MELILKSDNKQSIAKIIALAKELNVIVEEKSMEPESISREALKERILNFRATSESSFEDPVQWQRAQREDRESDISAILENQKKLLELEGKIELDDEAFR
ncbi:hypothetical protein [Mucilaginibacter sp. SJ]|uniref:hypothetical protein n=1 Tax=Mucilaginibacter sp. SJ TaxID=3029053 RepID=UPI0023A98459|nr:hypothetical protein [Mucilaginibacter sp. SJ]WDZ99746.1 hypothetical protein MusilaSJ_20005 [Mucilaginibacter sp. SJ]